MTALEKLLLSPFKTYLSLFLVALLVFVPSLFYGFSPIDENWLITGNTAFLKEWENLVHAFRNDIQNSYYRPLLIISFIVDYHFSELAPFFYHLSNCLFHALAVMLLFRFLRLLAVEARTAFFLCLLFAVHPLTTHTVAWIPGRNDSLLCIFTLLAFVHLLRYLENQQLPQLFLHGIFLLAALFTKETALILPFLSLWIYVMFRKNKKGILALSVSWLITVLFWYLMRQQVLPSFPTGSRELGPAIANFCLAMLAFTGKSLFPVFQSVSPTVGNTLWWLQAIIVVGVGVILYKRGIHNKKIAVTGLLIFFGMLSLTTWFGAQTTEGVHYEHRAYTSLVGLFVFLSQLKFPSNSRVFQLALGFVLLLFLTKTIFRQQVYQSEQSYLDEGLRDSPENHYFHYQKGLLLYQEGEYAASIIHMDRAIALWPNQVNLYNNRGNAHFKLRHKEATIADYTKALELSNYKTSIHLSRCLAYKEFGEIEKAKTDLEAIRRRKPDAVPKQLEVEINRLWLPQRVETLTALIAQYPQKAELYVERAQIYFYLRKGPEALADLQTATKLEPGNKQYQAYYNKLKATYPHK